MKQIQLGSSDLFVSELMMGTMQFGTGLDERQSLAILDAGFDAGINSIDTAEMYPVPTNGDLQGLPEKIIGKWLKTKNRDEIHIATKVTGPGQMRWIPTRRVPSSPEGGTQVDKASIVAACEGCLTRLGIEQIDLFQIHWPSRYIGGLFGSMGYNRAFERQVIGFEEQVEAMQSLIDSGKIKAWGVSNENSFGLAQFDEARRRQGAAPCVSIQNDFSMLARHFEPELAEACAPSNLNVGLLVYGALAGGTLSGKYRAGAKPKGRHTIYPDFQPRYHNPLSLEAARLYADLAERHGMTPTEMTVAWTLGREYVSSIIIGVTDPGQLSDLCKGTQQQLLPEILAEIEAIHRDNPNPNSRFHG